MSTRALLLLFVVLLLVPARAFASDSPLVITGTVVDVKPSRSLGEWFDVVLQLQYHNRSDETIIVPKPSVFGYGNRQLLFVEGPSAESKVSAPADEHRLSRNYQMPISSLIRDLKLNDPSHVFFAAIPPGGYFETADVFRSVNGWKLETRSSGEKSHRKLEFAVPEHSYFKLQYTLSLRDHPEGSDLILDAQRRWSRFGKLQLNSRGDFYLSTGVIINKLPD